MLRFHNVSTKELWYDEAFTAELVSNSYGEVFRLSKADVHPPLYYFTLKTFTSYFGNSELSLRLPSIIFGIALIPLTYFLILYMTTNKNTAILASLVISFNPFLVTHSKEARSSSMLAFLTVLTFFFLLKALRDKKYLPLAVLLPILFLTHYITAFVITVFVAILLWYDRKFIKFLLPLILIVLLWIPVIIASSSTTGLKWVPKFSLVRLPQSIHAFIIGVDNNKSRVSPPLNPFPINSDYSSLAIFLLVALIVGLSKPSKEPLLLILCSTVPMFLVALTSIYLGTNLYVERFMVGYASLLLIYCALVFPKSLVLIPYIILCIFLVLNYEPKNTGYRDLAKYASNKLIVMTDASEYITAKYYVRNIKLQEGDWREWVLIKDSDILDKQSAKESFYLVNRGPMENWIPKVIIGDFYFYDWKISNGT